jgi:osmotically-inducible protein OsmY
MAANIVKKTLVASVFLLSLASCAAIEGQETAGEYVDDATITTKVKAAFVADPKVKSFQVHVETMDGVVQLSGFVDSLESEKRAVELAAKVHGVESVKDNMVISPPNK